MQLGCSLATAVTTRDCKFSNVSRASAQLFHLALTCGGSGVSPSNISVQSSVNSMYAVIVTRLRRQGGSEILANAIRQASAWIDRKHLLGFMVRNFIMVPGGYLSLSHSLSHSSPKPCVGWVGHGFYRVRFFWNMQQALMVLTLATERRDK